MEVIVTHSERIVRLEASANHSLCGGRANTTLKHAKGLSSYLPDLEITPVVGSNSESWSSLNTQNAISIVNKNSNDKAPSKEQSDILNLLKQLPALNTHFKLHSKIGHGTFSTVYLATSRNKSDKKKYAVKHLTQNSPQLKIERELKCMAEIGGKDNVVSAAYSLHNGENCHTFIMPYLPHKRFCEYVLEMSVPETQLYMKNLLIALRRVHSFNVIHRDVKPGNFLYNRDTKQFLLIDFGLAQVLSRETAVQCNADENMPLDYSQKRKHRQSDSDDERGGTPVKRMALKPKDNNILSLQDKDSSQPKVPAESSSSLSRAYVKVQPLNATTTRKKLFQNDFNNTEESVGSSRRCKSLGGSMLRAHLESKLNESGGSQRSLDGEMLQTIVGSSGLQRRSCGNPLPHDNKSVGTNSEKSFTPLQRRSWGNSLPQYKSSPSDSEKSFTPLVAGKSCSSSFLQVRNSRVVRQQPFIQRPMGGCPCTGEGIICSVCESRHKMVAPRAGTPGFRPPEVLLKYPHQTTAVDMWASGVVLLCILSGCYPFFRSPNDLVALAEIMTIFGTNSIINIAGKFGRRVVCSNHQNPVNLKNLCKTLRKRMRKRSEERKDDKEPETEPLQQEFPDSAYSLLSRLLDVNPSTRITAADALQHPFILDLDRRA